MGIQVMALKTDLLLLSFYFVSSRSLAIQTTPCSVPTDPPFGSWVCSSSTSLSCSLICDPGWVVQGRSTVTCEEGKWSEPGVNYGCTAVEALLIAGNYDPSGNLDSRAVEIFGQYHGNDIQLEVAKLESSRSDSTLNYVNSQAIICGGWGPRKQDTCSRFYPDSEKGSWRKNYTLNAPRAQHMSVVLGNRLYLIGGFNSPFSSEYLEVCKSNVAKPGPALTSSSYRGCAVSISHDTFAVVGGYTNDCGGSSEGCGKREVVAYNITSQSHYRLPSLKYARMEHDCVTFKDKETKDVYILVTGGRYEGTNYLGKTELLIIGDRTWKTVGDLKHLRTRFALAVAENNVVAFGGWMEKKQTDIVEDYDFTTKTWTVTGKMIHP